MALVLVKEDGTGKTNSNTYALASDGDSYHETRLHVEDWTQASSGDKEKALAWASRILDDIVDWEGRAVDEDQAMGWPRNGVYDKEGYYVDNYVVPQAVVDATCELARTLLVEDTTKNPDTQGFSFIKADVVELQIDKADRDSKYILTDLVRSMIAPFGTINGTPRHASTVGLLRA
jgi:hypothetical protein